MSIVWKHIALPAALVSAICAIVACSNSESFEDPASISLKDIVDFSIQQALDPCTLDEDGDIVYKSENGEFLKCEDKKQVHVDVDVMPLDSLDFPTDTAVASSDTIPELSSPKNIEDDRESTIQTSSSKKYTSTLPLDDSAYPYAGIPRIVIETKNHKQINDRETEIPAKLQIYGKDAPETEITDLVIRGRGNSSWNMPKKSYKIKFDKEQSILGMSKDKEWALNANYADKTLLKNYITYKLSSWLEASFSPNCKFAELFLNQEYLGVYLFTETVKTGKNRVNINKENTFLAEFDLHHKQKNTTIFLAEINKPVTIHFPKNAGISEQETLKAHLDSTYSFIQAGEYDESSLSKWIDLNSYFLYYWIQEFSENEDGNFDNSVYFSWNIGSTIRMGPVWDFDLAYNGHPNTKAQNPQKWFIRNYYWNQYLFSHDFFQKQSCRYWNANKEVFKMTLDSLPFYYGMIEKSAQNNFKRWPILKDTEHTYHIHSYSTYQEAVDSLKSWVEKRYSWISEKCNKANVL